MVLFALACMVLVPGCSGRSKADKLHAEGVILFKNRQYYKAAEKLEEALKVQPNRPDTLTQLAEVYLNTDKFEQAVLKAQNAVTQAPAVAGGYLILGQAHLALARRAAGSDPEAKPAPDELAKAQEVAAQLRRALPDAMEGRLLQARIDHLGGNQDSAQKLYQAVLDKDPRNITAILGLTDVLMAKKDYAEAEKLARAAIQNEKTPNTAAINDLAIAQAMQGNPDAAYATLAPYITSANKQPEASQFMYAGRILLMQVDKLQAQGAAGSAALKPVAERLAELGRVMKGLYPSTPEAYFFRAVSYQIQGDVTNAIGHFEQACTKAPREKRFRMALALAHMQNKNYDSARHELMTLMRDNPGDDDARLRMAQCYTLEGSFDEAIDQMRSLVVDRPGNKTYKEALGKVLVLSSTPDNVKEGNALLAESAGSQGTAPGSRELYQAEAAIKEADALAQTGKFKESDSRLREAERLMSEAARLQPKNPFPELRLSELAVRRGDLFTGLRHVRAAARTEPQYGALEARFLAQLGQFDAARARYTALIAASPEALGYQLTAAELDFRLGRAKEAAASFDALVAKHPDDPRPCLSRALVLGRPSDAEAAAKFLMDHVKDSSMTSGQKLDLAQLLMKLRRNEDAAQVLAGAAAELEGKVTLLESKPEMKSVARDAKAYLAGIEIELALTDLLSGKNAEAAASALRAKDEDPGQEASARLIEAVASLRDGKSPASTPAGAGASRTMAVINALALLKEKGPAAASAALGKMQPNDVEGLNLFGRMLQKAPADKLAAAAPDLALLVLLEQVQSAGRLPMPQISASLHDLADQLLKTLPAEPFVLGVKAAALRDSGDLAGALAAYAALQQAAPDTIPAALALADLHMAAAERAQGQGRADEARRENEAAAAAAGEALKLDSKNARALEKLGMLRQMAGKTAEAESLFRDAIKIDPGRWSAYNNLAWNLAEAKKLDEAAQMGEKALAAAPGDGGVLDTAGWIELKRGNTAHAADLLGQASLQLPNNPEVRFHLAQALAATGDKNKAAAELEAIALATPQYPRIQEVREMIRQLNPQSEFLNGKEYGSSPNPTGAGPR